MPNLKAHCPFGTGSRLSSRDLSRVVHLNLSGADILPITGSHFSQFKGIIGHYCQPIAVCSAIVGLCFRSFLSSAVVRDCLPFSSMESSVTASQINCHSLMRICSKTDLLMIGILLRPQQDSCVISFFIQKDDRSVSSLCVAA